MKNETTVIPVPIIAALISAAATGAASAISTTFAALNTATPISCGLVNNTPYALTRFPDIYEPVHGTQEKAPDKNILSLLDGAEKEADEWKESNFTTWGLNGRGSGTEILTVYQLESLNIMVALYAGNPVIGAPYAGVSIGDTSWFMENQNRHKGDHKGKWLIDHIKDVHTKNCQYSKNGAPLTASTTDGLISVDFASAQQTTFKLQFKGDWTKFNVPS